MRMFESNGEGGGVARSQGRGAIEYPFGAFAGAGLHGSEAVADGIDPILQKRHRLARGHGHGEGAEAGAKSAAECGGGGWRVGALQSGEQADFEACGAAQVLVDGHSFRARHKIEHGVRDSGFHGRRRGKRVADVLGLGGAAVDDGGAGFGDGECRGRVAFTVTGDAVARGEFDDGVAAAGDGLAKTPGTQSGDGERVAVAWRGREGQGERRAFSLIYRRHRNSPSSRTFLDGLADHDLGAVGFPDAPLCVPFWQAFRESA
jgi:hypothetical protein